MRICGNRKSIIGARRAILWRTGLSRSSRGVQDRHSRWNRYYRGGDPENFDSDPIIEANDLRDAGDSQGAQDILSGLLEADLRCLDAHAHLGGLMFGTSPFWAVNHYEAGVRIGGLSLNPDFDVVLPWGRIDNRPFLRCLQGYGLCLWRLERFDEALKVFTRMLWLNPSDNQGVRFLLPQVQARKPWVEEK